MYYSYHWLLPLYLHQICAPHILLCDDCRDSSKNTQIFFLRCKFDLLCRTAYLIEFDDLRYTIFWTDYCCYDIIRFVLLQILSLSNSINIIKVKQKFTKAKKKPLPHFQKRGLKRRKKKMAVWFSYTILTFSITFYHLQNGCC